jgi:hypothetical protein
MLGGTSDMHGEIQIHVTFYFETLKRRKYIHRWEDNIKLDKK